MAQRRMMSLKIIDTDQFMDMPLSSQCLYFHLMIRADDDGFIGNQKKIIRMVGCNDDDMKILANKGFVIPVVIPNGEGVIVIAHWKVHNFIRADRYHETIYKSEKALFEAIDGTYQLSYQPDTEVRLELGKSKSKVNKEPPNPQRGKGLDYKFIESDEWRSLFKYWAENKKSRYTKQAGLVAGYSKLTTISGDNLETARQIIDQSLANNWAGLFEIGQSGKGNNQKAAYKHGGEINFEL